MTVSVPRQNVYYYECSNGKFRLVYFIPVEELEQLAEQGRISKDVLVDFPDGVDLDCTEPDFEEFEGQYGFRPRIAPEAMRRAFFALFSSTHDWQQFRGSGFVPAADLEALVETVEQKLEQDRIISEEIEPLPDEPTLEERRQRMNWQAIQQARVNSYLEELPVERIDPEKSLRQQKFTQIEMQEGEKAEEIFSQLHLKRKR